MDPLTKQFHTFLSACGGNWRNSLHISCRELEDGSGYLLSTDRDGRPVIMAVGQFCRLAGLHIDPDECCGHISEAAFGTLYARYLLWQLPSDEKHPLRQLSKPSIN